MQGGREGGALKRTVKLSRTRQLDRNEQKSRRNISFRSQHSCSLCELLLVPRRRSNVRGVLLVKSLILIDPNAGKRASLHGPTATRQRLASPYHTCRDSLQSRPGFSRYTSLHAVRFISGTPWKSVNDMAVFLGARRTALLSSALELHS